MPDKTYIPGADRRHLRGADTDPGTGSLYSPTPDAVQGTYIPGMGMRRDDPAPSPYGMPRTVRDVSDGVRVIAVQPRVMAGVLYSISKGLLGEIFPVYLGTNALGCDAGCEIRLEEETVSSRHGFLQVSRYTEDGPYQATYTDRDSEYGSSVNGADARYETLRLNDGDILQVGHHYRLLFKAFHTTMGCLYEDEDFHDTSAPPQPAAAAGSAEEEETLNFNADISNDFYAPSGKGARDKRTVMY